MSKTSRTADCLIFAARSEKSFSWRWADVAARSIASMASAGRSSPAASSVSWVTCSGYSSGCRRENFCSQDFDRLTPDTPGGGGRRRGCRLVAAAGPRVCCLGRFARAGICDGLEHALDLLDDVGVVLGVDLGEADHGAGHRELDPVEYAGAGDADGLAG